MSEFLEKRIARERGEHDQTLATYRTLARKAAAGKLTAAEDGRLNAAIDALALNVNEIAADLAIFIRVAELEPTAAAAPDALIEQEAADAQRAEFERRGRAAQQELENARSGFVAAQRGAANRLRAASEAAAELTRIRQEHFNLLGEPDPAVLAKRRHLIQGVFGNQPRVEGVILLESVMASPSQMRSTVLDPGIVFIPSPGQSQRELDDLIEKAKSLVIAGLPGRYIIQDLIDDSKLAIRECVVLGGADVSLYLFAQARWAVTWIEAPGQSTDEMTFATAHLLRRLCAAAREPIYQTDIDRARAHAEELIEKYKTARKALAEV